MLKRPARFSRGLVAQGGMRPDGVVVVAPEGQFAPGMRRIRKQSGGLFSQPLVQAVEDLFVQAFVALAAVEGLDIAVLPGLPGSM